MNEKLKEILNKLAEIIYDQYLMDLANGNIQSGIYKNKQVVGKSAQKARTFQQPALKFK